MGMIFCKLSFRKVIIKCMKRTLFFKQLLFKRIKITKVLFFYKYGWDDVRSSSAGYSLKFAKRIVTKSGDG